MIEPHEEDLIEVVINLLWQNESALVNGLSIQGEPRVIGQIVGNKHAPDKQYYFIRVIVPEYTLRPLGESSRPSRWEIEYRTQIDVFDFARLQPDDNKEAYKISNDTFRLLSDRIVSLIATQQSWLTGAYGQYGRPLDPARLAIRKLNLSDLFEEPDGSLFPGLVARITSNFIRQC